MTYLLPTLSAIQQSSALIRCYMPCTPQYQWPLLNNLAGLNLWIKHENHSPIGSFKVRGGIVYLDWLSKQGQETGVVSATRGNHGQSIAFAARKLGFKAVVVVPHGNSHEKNKAMQALGAELIEHGSDFHEADKHADLIATQSALHRVPSFHHLLVQGVSTYGYELLTAVPDLDLVYVAIGWGSGACGLAAARNALGLKTRIVGVVSSEAPAYFNSFGSGKVLETRAHTRIADGIAISQPHPSAFEIIQSQVERIIQVSDDDIEDAMRIYFTCTHNVAEGAGAAALAGALAESHLVHEKKVAAILTGGNVDTAVYRRVLISIVR